ncbi:zinc-binding dehydrogenase [Micromonospora sp. URMC 103]|uniref:zinc-binding dehydrogenase n=1 Tax=Micromonospora sp. URMC 103 TaxID=3423406 RepID=UPI003F1AACC4
MPTAAELFTQGRFTVRIEAVFPVQKATDAHETAEHGSHRGKIVLSVNDAQDV